MSNGSKASSEDESLSALVDGELEARAIAGACGSWRDDEVSRDTWHLYHLIGDVLRSDDLATAPVRDAAFLVALRARMADEPVVLAPTAVDVLQVSTPMPVSHRRVGASGRSRWSWMAPSAVAAGFVVVAGVVTVLNPAVPTRDSSVASSGVTSRPAIESQSSGVRIASLPNTAASAFPVSDTLAQPVYVAMPNRQLIRDARLDRYLSAHKEFAGSTALGVPSGFLRDAVAESPSR